MATFLEYLANEGYAKLATAKKLEEEDSKNDPEEDPFRSRYKAREKYTEVRQVLKDFINESGEDVGLKYFQAVLDFRLGDNYVETEELGPGEEYLTNSLSILEEDKYEREVVNVFQIVLNTLGILWSVRRNFDKSLAYLKQSETLYKKFKHDVGNDPKSVDEYFKPADAEGENDAVHISNSRSVHFENTYTHTLFFIAQVYSTTGRKADSAKYCHVTLQRQLDAQKYNALEWALNAATLSQYYMVVELYHFARHCLASAEFIFEEEVSKEKDISEDDKDKLMQGRADIDRCWVKYGLSVLESSKEHLLKETYDSQAAEDHNADVKVETVNDIRLEGNAEETGSASAICDVENLKTFPRFNLEATHCEEAVTDKLVRDFAEAREIFLFILKRLNDAKTYYVVDGHCSDYIEIIQDQSKAYKELAFFELDMERQCKMHKRRIDMLKETLTDLNRQHYLLVCRQLIYELAETFSSMVDLKLAIMESDGHAPTPHAVKKMNTLAQQSIAHYNEYLESLKGGKPEFPDEFNETDLRPALVAMVCMGRLHSKIIVIDTSQRLALMKKSCECYQFVVTYCNKHPSAEEKVESEVGLCREMVVLIPLKMEKVREGLM